MSTQPTISRENKDQEGAPGAKRRPTRRAQRTHRPAGGGRPEPSEPEAREPRREQAGPRLRPPADRPPLRINQVFPQLPQVHCCPTPRGPVIHSHDARGAPLLSPAHRPVSVPCHGADVAETPRVVAGGFHANQGHCRLPSSGRGWRAPNPAPGLQPVTG